MMRILVANDGLSDVGGVQSYLDAVTSVLEQRGHVIAHAYCTDSGSREAAGGRRRERFQLTGALAPSAFAAILRWQPDICFSHNMADLEVDRQLADRMPVVKFMHGYFGTCIGGLKTHAFPTASPCGRRYGAACLALYFARRCGRKSPAAFVGQWRWAERQRSLFDAYAAIVVASGHMRDEYARSGVDSRRLRVNALFPTDGVDDAPATAPAEPHVAFLGRMTPLKGGDLLVRAVAAANKRLATSIRLTMMGDGPELSDCQQLASRLEVDATFPGWVTGNDRWTRLRTASVVALPGVWPEPFGLVGLEAGARGVPAVAVTSGGVGEWLRDGINGIGVPVPPSPASFGDALAALLGDAKRLARMRIGAHQVASEMSVGAHVDRLETTFDSVRVSRSVA